MRWRRPGRDDQTFSSGVKLKAYIFGLHAQYHDSIESGEKRIVAALLASLISKVHSILAIQVTGDINQDANLANEKQLLERF